ncbi:sensor histidine kinase [Microbacterium esteraromaticum]|uniref:Sensor histidine kinase n=1 Tax=Microbacterium esteraromaticum TaxID=57043 RepID=A0A7D7WBF3_9MICO|nr:histidine kinase [Microbacterium esteraromaticum]QMU97538.1 sensor histidine kinase [Microbacterium esteraromaticum]
MTSTTAAASPRRVQASHWDRYGWLMAVVWMCFLIYPLLALLESSAPVGWIVAGWGALALFAVLYVVGFVRGLRGEGGLGRPPVRGQWTIFAALVVCAVVSVPAEGGQALSFLPFIMSFASYALTRIAHWATFAGAVIIVGLYAVLAENGPGYVTILAIVVLVGIVNTVSTWLIVRSGEAEQLGLELAMSEGREHVARDVHDLIGHSLTVVSLKAQLARRLIDTDPEQARRELAEIESLAAEAIAGVRSTVAGTRASSFDEQLAASGEVLRSAGIRTLVEGDATALSPAQGLTASWILREATTNILRHSEASTVTVLIGPGSLSVHDDGLGPGEGEGNGVRGMRERAAAAGARFTIAPAAERGTRVEVAW